MKNKKILLVSLISLILSFYNLQASEPIEDINKSYLSSPLSHDNSHLDELYEHYKWSLKRYNQSHSLLEKNSEILIQNNIKISDIELNIERFKSLAQDYRQEILVIDPQFFSHRKQFKRQTSKQQNFHDYQQQIATDNFQDLVCCYQWILVLLDTSYNFFQHDIENFSENSRTRHALQHDLDRYTYLEYETRLSMIDLRPDIQFESLPYVQPEEWENGPRFDYLYFKQKFKLPD